MIKHSSLKISLFLFSLLSQNIFMAMCKPRSEKAYKRANVISKHVVPTKKTIFGLPDISQEETSLESAPIYNFSITDYQEKDFESLKKIMKDNWKSLVSNGPYNEQFIDDYLKQKKSSNYPPHNLITKTLKNNDQVVGFIGYVLYDSANNNDPENPNPRCHIYLLNAPLDAGHIEIMAIDEAYRRHGAGSLLLNYAIKDLTSKGAKKINIAVNNDNLPALNCYRKLGFKIARKYDDHTFLVKKA